MSNTTQNILIFGTFMVVLGIVGYIQYQQVRKEVKTVYGV